jgi:hypothetical protein
LGPLNWNSNQGSQTADHVLSVVAEGQPPEHEAEVMA